MASPLKEPTIGGGVLLSNGNGWQPSALLLTTPLVILRYQRGITRLLARDQEKPFYTGERNPLELLEQVLQAIASHLPAPGPKAGKPTYPIALTAMSYEFGRMFAPHQDAFAFHAELTDDEFFASIFIDAFRPDSREGTERVGYAGSVPEGWFPGAPALETTPYGHEAPALIPHFSLGMIERKPLVCDWDFDTYRGKFKAVQEYLAAGDIYQANLTVPFRGRTPVSPEAVFDVALKRGGSTYGGMMITPTGTILSLSPELFLRRRGDEVETHPIKGTRRIPDHMGGAYEAKEALLTSEKEKAEHLMIVDLERNDLGRVCRSGSVKVEPLMRAVEHPTVMHLESVVKGQLLVGTSLNKVVSSTFPGGSVTGAPKKRALEILSELEGAPRGMYCGAFGWIDAEGDCDLNLPIRTAIFRPDGTVEYHAGGGIVADSTAEEEWKEMHEKVRFFSEALAEAEFSG